MGRMSELDIALHEEGIEETEAELLEGIGRRFLKLAKLKSERPIEDTPEDRLTNTYETDESLDAKDAYEREHGTNEHGWDEEPEPEESLPTLPEVRKVLAELSRAGFTLKVKALIQSHGCQKLSEVKREDYPALLEEAGRIGKDGR